MNDSEAIAGLIGLGVVLVAILFWLLWITLIIGGLVFWVMMLVDAAKREYPKSDDRVVWILVVAIAGVVGAIIYYFAVKRPATKRV